MKKLIKRLDLIVKIMLESKQEQSKNKITIRDLVCDLYNFGISTQDIADILGKNRNSIDIHLTNLRKSGKVNSGKIEEENNQNIEDDKEEENKNG
jgi:predicted ArsR family transcriptional regulator